MQLRRACIVMNMCASFFLRCGAAAEQAKPCSKDDEQRGEPGKVPLHAAGGCESDWGRIDGALRWPHEGMKQVGKSLQEEGLGVPIQPAMCVCVCVCVCERE
ncbi:hypothetical protein GOP47_0021202, partial [Adiantum capillus-veneris]